MACEQSRKCHDGSHGSCCGEWDEIPDTPEQRALIKEHNERMRREYPDLEQIDPPIESGEQEGMEKDNE